MDVYKELQKLRQENADLKRRLAALTTSGNEPCVFYEETSNTCGILTSGSCHNCSFYKTKEQYNKDLEAAEQLLKRKGFKSVTREINGEKIRTVEKI